MNTLTAYRFQQFQLLGRRDRLLFLADRKSHFRVDLIPARKKLGLRQVRVGTHLVQPANHGLKRELKVPNFVPMGGPSTALREHS
jgi:hypothetical protein